MALDFGSGGEKNLKDAKRKGRREDEGKYVRTRIYSSTHVVGVGREDANDERGCERLM